MISGRFEAPFPFSLSITLSKNVATDATTRMNKGLWRCCVLTAGLDAHGSSFSRSIKAFNMSFVEIRSQRVTKIA